VRCTDKLTDRLRKLDSLVEKMMGIFLLAFQIRDAEMSRVMPAKRFGTPKEEKWDFSC
jgi:hypothetical protein